MSAWEQVYAPHGWPWLPCALVAALLLTLTVLRQSAPRAALIGAVSAILGAANGLTLEAGEGS